MLDFLKRFKSSDKKQYNFDVNLNVNGNIVETVGCWLNENIDNWTDSYVLLHNPIDGDILIYRIHFANIEDLTHFKLWYKQKGEL